MSAFQLFTIKDCLILALFIGVITAGIVLLFYSLSLIVKSGKIGKGYPPPIHLPGPPIDPPIGEPISLDMIFARNKDIPVCHYCETLNSPASKQCCACRKPLP